MALRESPNKDNDEGSDGEGNEIWIRTLEHHTQYNELEAEGSHAKRIFRKTRLQGNVQCSN